MRKPIGKVVKDDYGPRRVTKSAKKGTGGHSQLRELKLSSKEMETLNKNGFIYRTILGVKKRITPGCVLSGRRIRYYIRSDTGKPAIRNYARDSKMKATHRAPANRKMMGD